MTSTIHPTPVNEIVVFVFRRWQPYCWVCNNRPKAYTAYRTASNVGRPLIEVVTPRNIANDRTGPNLRIKTLIDYLCLGRHQYRILSMVSIRVDR